MTSAIIITLCVLLLVAYLFDFTAPKTRIPSVVLLLLLGWTCQQITKVLHFDLPDLNPALPILGTIGLILIVLEGSLELELKKSKRKMIRNAFIMALLPMLVLAAGITLVLTYYGWNNQRINLVNSLPLCIISSAIAIPTARSLSATTREFITYESSFSDIVGVLFFNFLALNTTFEWATGLTFFLHILIMVVISIVATIFLAMMLNRIKHPIRYIPILLIVILIYSVCKIYHLPGLIFILLFGLFLGNLLSLQQLPFLQQVNLQPLKEQVHKLHDILVEGAFLVRSLFFILFGFLLETSDLLNTRTLSWSVGITVGLFVIRAIHLRLLKLPMTTYLPIAPRGLITILLFLSIEPGDQLVLFNKSLVMQVILLSALVMMFGMMSQKKESESHT